jgi:hypothetical protein
MAAQSAMPVRELRPMNVRFDLRRAVDASTYRNSGWGLPAADRALKTTVPCLLLLPIPGIPGNSARLCLANSALSK